MSDLISRSEVMEMLTNIELSCTATPTIDAKLRLREIPTAYNVDKVVEELEEEKSDWNYDYNVPINRAIEIVRKGGVENG